MTRHSSKSYSLNRIVFVGGGCWWRLWDVGDRCSEKVTNIKLPIHVVSNITVAEKYGKEKNWKAIFFIILAMNQ